MNHTAKKRVTLFGTARLVVCGQTMNSTTKIEVSCTVPYYQASRMWSNHQPYCKKRGTLFGTDRVLGMNRTAKRELNCTVPHCQDNGMWSNHKPYCKNKSILYKKIYVHICKKGRDKGGF